MGINRISIFLHVLASCSGVSAGGVRSQTNRVCPSSDVRDILSMTYPPLQPLGKGGEGEVEGRGILEKIPNRRNLLKSSSSFCPSFCFSQTPITTERN